LGVGSRAFGQAEPARTHPAHAFDSTLYFFERTGRVAEKFRYLDVRLRQMARYADGLNGQGRHEQALAVNWQAVELARQQGLREQLADAYNNLAATYEKKGDYETCLGYYLRALPIYESLGATPGLLTLYRNLCALYGFTLGQYDTSLRYGDKALALARQLGDAYGVATVQVNRGVALRRTKRYGAALAGYREAYAIARQLDNVPLQEVVLLKMINVRVDRQQYDQVIAVAEKVLPLTAATRNPSNRAMALRGLAVAYLHRKEFARAQAYARQALDLCRRYDLKEIREHIALLASDVALALGNTADYDRLRREAASVYDHALNEEVRQNLRELETKYEADRKETRIRQLQQETQRQGLRLHRKNAWNYVLAATTLSLLAVGFLFYRNARNGQIIFHQREKIHAQRIRELEQAQQLLAANAMLQGQEAERGRLAKDLHDGLGGMLSGIKLSLSQVQSNALLPAPYAAGFALALQQLDATIGELRRVAHSMMPQGLVRYGLAPALRDFCGSFEGSAPFRLTLQTFGLENRLAPDEELILYRIVQELLNNVVKHAAATEVLVQLIRTADVVTLAVEDNGAGFDATRSRPGMGLGNIRSRADHLGATLDIHSTPGVGTSVTVSFTPK
jgi:signal transduction histidine kinase